MSSGLQDTKTLSVAPMMAWTDRWCRRVHRAFSPNARLYTEMITTGALIHGPAERLLALDPAEHPVAVQLGGSHPDALAQCARLATESGFDEVNLNVGCPSPRVQQGAFGACLMKSPELVADCVRAMIDATHVPVTVKCRLGVDGQDSDRFLDRFARSVADAGCAALIVHARIAHLDGLSPAQNRHVPPLRYDRVRALRNRLHEWFGSSAPLVIVNGGLADLDAVVGQWSVTDGAMIGRAAYRNPWLLAELDHALFGTPLPDGPEAVITSLTSWIDDELAAGTRLHAITRHLLGLFNGRPGARRFRQILSHPHGETGAALLYRALEPVIGRAA